MATVYDYELNEPRLARQKDLDTCWACCFSVLFGANQSAKQASESELVRAYATTPTGGIDASKLQKVASDFDYIANPFWNDAAARGILTDGFIKDRLRLNGMMMAAWKVQDPDQPDKTFFHAQVVWGVAYMSNQEVGTDRALLRTMNPATRSYQLYPLFMIYRPEKMPMFVAYPKSSRG